jgi:hypothetical protein
VDQVGDIPSHRANRDCDGCLCHLTGA